MSEEKKDIHIKNKKISIVRIIILLFIILFLVFITIKLDEPFRSKRQEKAFMQAIKDNKFNCIASLSDMESDVYYKKIYYKPDKTSCDQILTEKSKQSPVLLEELPKMKVKRNSYQQTYTKDDNVYIFGGNVSNEEAYSQNFNIDYNYNCKLDYYDGEIFNTKKKTFKKISGNLKQYMSPQNCLSDRLLLLSENILFYKGAIFDIEKNIITKANDNLIKFKENEIKQLKNLGFIGNSTQKNFNNEEALFVYGCKYKNYKNGKKNINEPLGCTNIILLNKNKPDKYKKGTFANPSDSYEAIMLKNKKILLISPTNIRNMDHSIMFNGKSSLELYDPKTGEITTIKENISLFRENNVVLDDGRVLIVVNNEDKSSFEVIIYNPDNNSIKSVKDSNYYIKEQDFNAKGLLKPFVLNDDYILLIPNMRFFEEYSCKYLYPARLMNIKTGQITDLSNIRLPYPWVKLTRLPDSAYLVTGGIKCKPNGENSLVSDYAAILSLKNNKETFK